MGSVILIRTSNTERKKYNEKKKKTNKWTKLRDAMQFNRRLPLVNWAWSAFLEASDLNNIEKHCTKRICCLCMEKKRGRRKTKEMQWVYTIHDANWLSILSAYEHIFSYLHLWMPLTNRKSAGSRLFPLVFYVSFINCTLRYHINSSSNGICHC